MLRARHNWLAGALLLVTTGAGAAGGWQYSGTLYLWAAGIDAATAGGADIDVDFDTLLDNLNMAFMGTVEARRDPWSVVADAVYLNVGGDKGATVEVPVAPGSSVAVDVEAGVKTRGWALNLLGAYTVWADERATLDLLAGARYLELKAEFDLGLNAAGRQVARSRSVLGAVWDGVVGVKGQVKLDDRWYLPFYADVGTGESDLTWQLFGGVGYAFDWGEVSLVYRHMHWDFDSGARLNDLSFSGPAAAVTWRF
jgi:hypothetical protein